MRDVVVADRVSKSFGSGESAAKILDGVSMTVPEGHFVSIVGPSGCGKSTLLQIIAGLGAPSGGEIRLDGAKISGPSPEKIGVVFQEALLLPWKTAAENVEFPLKLRSVGSAAERRERALDLLRLVGLEEAAGRYPHQLSGGMRQRVAIARGLVRQPRVLLMDEPFAALDEQSRTRMWQELIAIRERSGVTVLFITHSLVEAVFLSDIVYVMAARPGRFIERIEVDLPQHRTIDLLGSEHLGALRNRLWDLIAGPMR